LKNDARQLQDHWREVQSLSTDKNVETLAMAGFLMKYNNLVEQTTNMGMRCDLEELFE